MKIPPRAASRYANALLSLARESDALTAVSADIAQIRAAVEQSGELARFLDNPMLPQETRRRALQTLFQSRVHPLTWNLLMVLASKRRLPLLPAICAVFQSIEEAGRGIVRGTMTAALPAAADAVSSMADQVGQRFGKTVLLSSRTDPALLGGCRVQVGDIVYDCSLAARLRLAKQSLAGG